MAKRTKKKLHVCLVEFSVTSGVLEFGRRMGPGSIVDLTEKIGTVKDENGREHDRTLGDEIKPEWVKELELEAEFVPLATEETKPKPKPKTTPGGNK